MKHIESRQQSRQSALGDGNLQDRLGSLQNVSEAPWANSAKMNFRHWIRFERLKREYDGMDRYESCLDNVEFDALLVDGAKSFIGWPGPRYRDELIPERPGINVFGNLRTARRILSTNREVVEDTGEVGRS